MKLKSFAGIALSSALLFGMGVTTIALTTPETHAAPKKKVTRKKAAAATRINFDNKTFRGTFYRPGEPEVELHFMPAGNVNVCVLRVGEDVFQGTYKVTAKTVSVSFWDGADTTWKFDIRKNGTQLYYEYATANHAYDCELDLVKE